MLANRFQALETSDDLDTVCGNITSIIMEAATEIAGCTKHARPDKLSAGTKQLREKRRQMKRGFTDILNIEYSELCKAIRRRMTEEINTYNEDQQLKALEKNRGLKNIKRK